VSGYERIQKFQNIAVGIFVILGLAALGWLIFKFNDLPMVVSKINSFQISVQFATAPGVQKDTPVRFCGYQVGRVTDIKPPKMRYEIRDGKNTDKQYHQSLVILNIDKQYTDIPSNVRVKLVTRGLGSSYIELVNDPRLPLVSMDANRPEESKYLTDGLLLQGSVGTSSEFLSEETQRKLDDVISSIDEIMSDPNNKQNIKQSLANFSQATSEATVALKQFETFLASANQSSEELTKMVATLGLILNKINSGEGTAGRIINDARFYESLLENSRQLQTVLEEIRQVVKKVKEKGFKIQL
jgi:phospholipid/cholesterol/gamma-HCH transport system substrate-binding protein